MNTFLRNINISNKDTVDDVIGNCNRINTYLSLNWCTKITYDDVESLLKAAIFVEEAIAMFSGDMLIAAMISGNPADRDAWNVQVEMYKSDEYIINIISKILKTQGGFCHLPALEEILRGVYDKERIEHFIREAKNKDVLTQNMQSQYDGMLDCVQDIFHLPDFNIPYAIESLLHEMHFARLAYVLLVPPKSAYYSRCSIIVQRICVNLSAGTIPSYFIDSMHQTIACVVDGRQLYWKCLGNSIFARHLRNFFIKFFNSFASSSEEEQQLMSFYKLENVCYLLTFALTTESPSRLALQHALRDVQFLPAHLAVLQRQIIIYS